MVTTGSLARVPPDRLRVLPKARTPASGGSVGALSRYVCALLTSVDVRSHKLPTRRRGTNRVDHINFLLLPWPLQVRESDFRVVQDSQDTTTAEPSGLFEFSPSEPFDLDLLDRVLLGHTKKSRMSTSCCCRRAPWTRPSLTTSKRFSPSMASGHSRRRPISCPRRTTGRELGSYRRQPEPGAGWTAPPHHPRAVVPRTPQQAQPLVARRTPDLSVPPRRGASRPHPLVGGDGDPAPLDRVANQVDRLADEDGQVGRSQLR